MLLQFRQMTRGAIAAVILGLVGLAMVLFLPSGSFQLGTRGDLVRIRDQVITPSQLNREIDVTLERMRNQGVNMSRQDAIDQGGHLQLLEQMIGRRAIIAYADHIGVSASDAQVVDLVRRIPAVQNPLTGDVDEAAFRQFLANRNYTETEFRDDLRGDLTTQMLMQAMISGVRAPSSYGAMALAFETETRTVTIAQAPAALVGQIPQPNDAQVQTFYEENQANLRVPEYRTITLVFARPEDFMARVDVPEARLREEFEARAASMTRPERRSYVRLSAPSEDAANQAAQRLARGEDIDTVAQDLGLQAARGEDQLRNEVSDQRVAETVFSTPARSAPRVIRAQLSPWAVVRVDAVTPAVEPSFAEARDQIRSEIAAEEAADMLNDAIRVFEEARAGGAPVNDAAREANLPSLTIPAVDEHGHDRNDAEIEALQGDEELIDTAFRTAEGESSDFIPLGAGDVVVSVDRVIPASVRPLEEVREDLVRAWISQERVRRLRDLAREVTEAVAGGQDFVAAARAQRMEVVVRSEQVDRRTVAQAIPARGMSNLIFSARVGDVVSDLRIDGGAIILARVEDVQRIDPNEQPQLLEAARAQADEQLVGSVADTLRDEIVAWARPDRNQRLLDGAYRSSDEQDDEAQ